MTTATKKTKQTQGKTSTKKATKKSAKKASKKTTRAGYRATTDNYVRRPKTRVFAKQVDDFDEVCPIDVGFKCPLRRGNSGVFEVSFSLDEQICERAGFDVDWASFSCVYDFAKGQLLRVTSHGGETPPALFRANGAVFYPHDEDRRIYSRDGKKLYWSKDTCPVEKIHDELWACRVEDYFNDQQFEEWARAVLRKMTEAAFSKVKTTRRVA